MHRSITRSGLAAARFLAVLFFAGALGIALATPAFAARCLVPALKAGLPEMTPNPALERRLPPGEFRTPPANPQVGDSWTWWLFEHGSMGPQFVQRTCTVRGKSDRAYVVVENSQWLVRVDQDDVDVILDRWENTSVGDYPDMGIYDLNTQHFGEAPDALDNDPRIYIMWFDFGLSADGFFFSFDEEPEGTYPEFHSNECEVLYMNSDNGQSPSGDYMTSVIAHEFQHMIHWNHDPDESLWLDEGMGELAMWLYGHPDQVILFPNAPDNSLTYWPTSGGTFAEYVQVYLWSLYFYEHFGGQPTIQNLVSQPANSYAGVQATLTAMGYTTTFPELVADWMTANFLDDPSLEGGKYNYAGEDLPNFAAATKSTYPVPVTNGTAFNCAADYVKFVSGQPQRLNFNGGDAADWAPRVIKYLGGVPLSVEPVTLNSTDDGSLDLPGFGSAYDQVVLVIGNVQLLGGNLSTAYNYSTETLSSSVPEGPGSGIFAAGAAPNPFRQETALRLRLDQAGVVQAAVHAADGRRIRDLGSVMLAAGEHRLAWDGRDDAGRTVPSGTYFLRARGGDEPEATIRVTVVR